MKSYKFATNDGHILHVEESGNPKGIPTLFLHGGPGAGIGQNYQWPFANGEHRLIAFDQRGCGHSQPFGSLENNTTEKLIGDIESLRKFFNVDSWLIFGGSWGSTLGLAYAIAYPDKVVGMVLRGIFLGRKEDADWFISNTQGASQIFATQYADFLDTFNHENPKLDVNRDSLCQWYFDQLTDVDESTRSKAATRWFNWEGSISKLEQVPLPQIESASTGQVFSLALLECYYLLNACFMPDNHILHNTHKISHIPIEIVHGRYDMVCKCESAIKLHQALPNSTLTIVENAGHSMTEAGISKALVAALVQIKLSLKRA
jgi:proline iminopeptidase